MAIHNPKAVMMRFGAGYAKALLEGVEFRRKTYTLDRQFRQPVIAQMLTETRPLVLNAVNIVDDI